MSPNQHMVIRNRIVQEIRHHFLRRLDPHLRPAEVGLELTTLQRHIHRQHPLHVPAHLDQRVVARRQVAVDSYTDTGFKMRRVLVLLGHA